MTSVAERDLAREGIKTLSMEGDNRPIGSMIAREAFSGQYHGSPEEQKIVTEMAGQYHWELKREINKNPMGAAERARQNILNATKRRLKNRKASDVGGYAPSAADNITSARERHGLGKRRTAAPTEALVAPDEKKELVVKPAATTDNAAVRHDGSNVVRGSDTAGSLTHMLE
jgi:hypothetical protein